MLKTIWHRKYRLLWAYSRHGDFRHGIIEGKIMVRLLGEGKGWSYIARYNGRERLWTVERFNLRQLNR